MAEVKYKWNAGNDEGASTPSNDDNGYANQDVADKLGDEQDQNPNPNPNPQDESTQDDKPQDTGKPNEDKPDEKPDGDDAQQSADKKPNEDADDKPNDSADQKPNDDAGDSAQDTIDKNPELSNEQLLELLKKKGFKGESLEDLTQEPQKPNRPKGIDEETEKFLEYQERTGRGLKDWNALNEDLSTLSPIELAKDRIRKENEGIDLSPEDLNYLLEDELGFDPTDEDLEPREKVKFKKFYGEHLRERQAEQKKYNEPVEGFTSNKADASQPNDGGKVQLSNGAEVDMASYQEERRQYLESREKALADLGEEEFKVSFDGKNGKEEMQFSYNYTDEDRHSMLSTTDDVGSILQNYHTEAGEFDHKSFNQDVWWTKKENRGKAIAAIAAKVRADVIAETVGERRNVNLNAPQQPSKPTKDDGYAKVAEHQPSNAFGVKYPLPNKA